MPIRKLIHTCHDDLCDLRHTPREFQKCFQRCSPHSSVSGRTDHFMLDYYTTKGIYVKYTFLPDFRQVRSPTLPSPSPWRWRSPGSHHDEVSKAALKPNRNLLRIHVVVESINPHILMDEPGEEVDGVARGLLQDADVTDHGGPLPAARASDSGIPCP